MQELLNIAGLAAIAFVGHQMAERADKWGPNVCGTIGVILLIGGAVGVLIVGVQAFE